MAERSDILALMPGRQEMILHVSFIYPCFDTYVHAAACTDGAAAQRRDEEKRHHYRTALPATVSSRVKVVPLSHEVFGRFGTPASQHLNLLGNIAASTGVVDKSAFIDQALRELALATVRSNHEIVYLYAAGVHTRVQGKVLLPGPLVPCADASAPC